MNKVSMQNCFDVFKSLKIIIHANPSNEWIKMINILVIQQVVSIFWIFERIWAEIWLVKISIKTKKIVFQISTTKKLDHVPLLFATPHYTIHGSCGWKTSKSRTSLLMISVGHHILSPFRECTGRPELAGLWRCWTSAVLEGMIRGIKKQGSGTFGQSVKQQRLWTLVTLTSCP